MGGAEAADPLVAQLGAAGFLAADEEAVLLRRAADGDAARLDALVARRMTGEPLAWITGNTTFGGIDVHIDAGVYVPRWYTAALAVRAAGRLADDGIAVDCCTGSGAIACVLLHRRPRARVIGVDVDPRAVACARRNGVDALQGDLFEPLPAELRGKVGVITAAVPFVPTGALGLLQRDTFMFETPLAYDGGPDGTDVLRRVVRRSVDWLCPGGALLLELGADQPVLLRDDLHDAGFSSVEVLRDEDGDVRGVEAIREG